LKYITKLNKFWQNNKIKNSKYEIYRLKKRFYDRLVSSIKKKAKKVVIGKYKNIKGMKYGRKLPPIKYFIQKLRSNHIDVFEIDEYNSSKLCCICGYVLRSYDAENKTVPIYITKKSGFYKLKYCEVCEKIWNRDINASRNIGRIFYHMEHKHCRPKIFDRAHDIFNNLTIN
jgi:transposase